MAIKLYTHATANGFKVSIVLELLGLKYDAQKLDFSKKEQKEEWFIKLNPNGRIPTLVDSETDTVISETAAIVQYLVDTYDKDHKISYKYGTPLYYKQLELLYFQMAGVGPMLGQYFHFSTYADEKIPYAIERYSNEGKRLLKVVESYLELNKENGLFLVGDHLSIADICIFTWVNGVFKFGFLDPAEWELLYKWKESILAIPEVVKGLGTPA